MNEILDKYSDALLKNIDIDNMKKIMIFLQNNNCDYIEDIIEDYLDIFVIDYNLFANKFNNLNQKYNDEFLTLAKEDMNLFEELFYD